MAADRKLDGIHFMLPTPFDSSGEVDTASFTRLLAGARDAGCTGVVTLGVMGEAHRLTDAERGPIIDGNANEIDRAILSSLLASGEAVLDGCHHTEAKEVDLDDS